MFNTFVSVSDYKIIAITETWCSATILDNEIFPPGFTIYRRDRDSRGGGILLAVSDCLSSYQLYTDDSSESLIVQVFIPQPVFVCVVYVPPLSPVSYLSSLYSFISSKCCDSNLILLGDFNCHDVCWSSLCASNPLSCSLCDMVFDLGLHQQCLGPGPHQVRRPCSQSNCSLGPI